MSVTRRLFIASALGLAFLGSKAFAEEKSPLDEFLSNVKDKAMKEGMREKDEDKKRKDRDEKKRPAKPNKDKKPPRPKKDHRPDRREKDRR